MARYKVMVGDNFHVDDETERADYGTFSTAAEALQACRDVVDNSLLWEYVEGATAKQLYDRYADFGDDPFVMALDGAPKVEFAARSYARQRAMELSAPGETGAQLRQTLQERKDLRLRERTTQRLSAGQNREKSLGMSPGTRSRP